MLSICPPLLRTVIALAACASILASCSSGSASYQAAALQASDGGDQKTAISLAKKEVERFSGPDQCSRTSKVECGTLALAYGALASYQILDRDRAGGEGSFIQAKGALSMTDPAIKASATGIVYRDISEAFWKAGDHERAIAVFKEGRAAGGDQYLFMSSAARAAGPQPTDKQPADKPPTDKPPTDKPLTD
ncbi:MAG: hypothetical protein K2X72_18400 [Reyranella sp.]|nr:hypothetical protein [Reyranella sp.]